MSVSPRLSEALGISKKLGPVLPLCYGNPCACGGAWVRELGKAIPHEGHDVGKAPIGSLVPKGVLDATTSPAKIDMWWRRHPDANVGLDLKSAGLIFIDPDSPAAYAEAIAQGVEGGIVRESRNPGWLFKRPDDCSIINISKSADGTDLEIRADGYAVVAGVHQNGTTVSTGWSAPLVDAPAWVVERLRRKAAEKAAQEATRAARRAERANSPQLGNEPLWQLDELGMERWRGELFEVDDDGNLDRSRSLFHIGLTVAEAGATEAGVRWAIEDRDQALGWEKYTGRADADTRYTEIAEKVVATVQNRGLTWDPTARPTVGVGAEACHGCAERDETIEALRDQISEHKAERALLRSGVVPTAEAMGLLQLVSEAASALSRGEREVKVYVPAIAESAGVASGTMTRALNQVRRWQEDEGIADTLPFTVEDYWERGKQHVKLLVKPAEGGPRHRKLRLHMVQAFGHQRRDEQRAQHGGVRRHCPKHPDAEIIRTTQWRCSEGGCSWMEQATAVENRHRHQDGAGQVGDVSLINGEPFVTEVQGRSDDRHQDGPEEYLDYRHQDGAGVPKIPVSFVTRADLETAAKPHLRLVALPDPCVRPDCGAPCGPSDTLLCPEHRAEAGWPAVARGAE